MRTGQGTMFFQVGGQTLCLGSSDWLICGTGERNFCGTQSGTHPLTDLDTIILPAGQMSTEKEYDPGKLSLIYVWATIMGKFMVCKRDLQSYLWDGGGAKWGRCPAALDLWQALVNVKERNDTSYLSFARGSSQILFYRISLTGISPTLSPSLTISGSCF